MSTDGNVFTTGSIELLSAGAVISLPFHEFVQELEVEVLAGSSWRGAIKLFDHQGDRLEKLIIAAGKDREIIFRWGWDDPKVSFQRTFIGAVIRYMPEFMPHGVLLNLEVLSRSVLAQVIDKKIRSFPEGQTISDIVRAIAEDRGWEAVIEDSVGAMEQPFSTKGESDLNFIVHTLTPHAVNAGGSDFMARFDESDIFHFHSPGFQGGGPLNRHNYRYTRAIAGDVISFAVQDGTLFGLLLGGGNSLYSSPNSNIGGQEEQKTEQGTGLAGVGAPAVVDASSVTDMGDGVHSFNNITARDPLEVERLTQARYAAMRRKPFQARMRVHGTHRARVFDYIDLDFTKSDGTPHYLSGNFQILEIKHVLGVGIGWTTEFGLHRQGTAQLPGTKPLAVSQTITPSEAAQGGVTLQAQLE